VLDNFFLQKSILKAQIAEEDALNNKIADNLAKIQLPEKQAGILKRNPIA
jgi:hypothetical protein